MRIAETLRDTRRSHKLSQRAIALILGVNYTYISKLESDSTQYPPSDRFIARFAEHFNLDCDRLMLECGRIPVKMQPAIALLVLEKMDSKERRF